MPEPAATEAPHQCDGCAGPVDLFLAPERGLVLHKTLALDLRLVDWKRDIMSMNDRDHKHERNRKNGIWLGLGARAGASCPPLEWARVLVFYRYPTNHRRDIHNLMPTSKAIVDGLVQAGVLPDDNDRYLMGPDNRREPVNGPHQVVVRVFSRA